MERTSKFANRKKIPSRFSKNDDRVKAIIEIMYNNDSNVSPDDFSNEGLHEDNNILYCLESNPNEYFFVVTKRELRKLLMEAIESKTDDKSWDSPFWDSGYDEFQDIINAAMKSIYYDEYSEAIDSEAEEWLSELSEKEFNDLYDDLNLDSRIKDRKGQLKTWFIKTYENPEDYFEDVYGEDWENKIFDDPNSLMYRDDLEVFNWNKFANIMIDNILNGDWDKVMKNLLFDNSDINGGTNSNFYVFKIKPTDLPDWFVNGESPVY